MATEKSYAAKMREAIRRHPWVIRLTEGVRRASALSFRDVMDGRWLS